jgi:preprotein translocase subunit SecG
MYTVIVILHIVVSLALILIILLQTGKGADIGAVFGGGSSQTLFGSSGPTSFLGKITGAAAVIFMLTSLFLAYFSGSRPASSIMKGEVPDDAGAGRRARDAFAAAGIPRSAGRDDPAAPRAAGATRLSGKVASPGRFTDLLRQLVGPPGRVGNPVPGTEGEHEG